MIFLTDFLVILLILLIIAFQVLVSLHSEPQGYCKSNWLVSGLYHLCRHLDVTSLCSAKSFIISLSDFPPSIMWFGVTDVS